MKIIALLLICPFFAMSQSKIEGIGKYKIGKSTIAIIDSVKSELSYRFGMGYSTYIFESVPDSTSSDPTVYCSGVRVFISIEGLRISGIELGYTRFTFYRDTLIRMEFNYDFELEHFLTLKYGNPILKDESRTINCTYKLTGRSVAEREERVTKTWSNGKIKATSKIDKRLNDKCKIEDSSFFKIELQPLASELDMCSQKEKNRLTTKNVRQKLKDF